MSITTTENASVILADLSPELEQMRQEALEVLGYLDGIIRSHKGPPSGLRSVQRQYLSVLDTLTRIELCRTPIGFSVPASCVPTN